MTNPKTDTGQAIRFRSAGLDLARELADQAVWADGTCAFHGAKSPESLSHPPRAGSAGADLYEGSAGIARFLGMAAALSADGELRQVALGAIRHALAHSEGWSLFTGGTGVGLVALELAERLDEPGLIAAGVALIDRNSAAATEAVSGPHDLLAGTAGVVLSLVAARRYDPHPPGQGWPERATQMGRALLEAALPDGPDYPDGPPLSWPLQPGSAVRLCGVAHGASGVALAFEALAAADPAAEAQWRAAARRARTFERAHYSTEVGSWADLRPPEPGGRAHPAAFPHMWCHGSVGVSAERLGALRHDEQARSDAVGGLAGARAYAELLIAGPTGPGGGDAVNGSLCHGLGGLVDLFIGAWRVSGDSGWMALAGQLGELMLNDARRSDGWRSGIPGGWPAPGLMLGMAGTGWALLRLAEPDTVPSGWRVDPS